MQRSQNSVEHWYFVRSIAMKVLSVALAAALLVPASTLAQTCASNCGARPIQFVPGQPVQLEMVNRTPRLLQVEQINRTDPIALLPGQALQLDRNFGTEPNTSVAFWDITTLSVRAVVSQPQPQTLRIEIYPGQSPGDRSVYIQNDGRVTVF